jgi:methionine-rich copper-binding protein CopC
MTRISVAPLVAVAAVSTVAFAHPLPRAATPAPNAMLAASPPEIRITFSEGLVAAFCGVDLKDPAGKSVPLGPAVVSPTDSKVLAAPLRAGLAPGVYTVSWHALGADTHRVAGHYTFQVKP